MSKFVAFLRAINVGGGRTVKMQSLRQVFESLRFSRVTTFIASGNVVFETRTKWAKALERKIERALKTALGYEARTHYNGIILKVQIGNKIAQPDGVAKASQPIRRQKYASRTGVPVRCTIENGRQNMSTQTVTSEVKRPKVVSAKEWEAARQKLLAKEKELTHARDALAAERRRMPWLAVEKDYKFDGPDGKATLLDLFDGRRQLIVYRAFFEPGVKGWPEHACVGCSMVADQVAHPAHLNARNTTLVFASRAPQKDIKRLKARMGWEFITWYTITDEFDKDCGVDEWHGTNAFIRDGDRVFRTYFVNNRGDEQMGNTWNYLDITALGRQEEWEDSPKGNPQTPPYEWWIWHDEPNPDSDTPGLVQLRAYRESLKDGDAN